MPFIEVIDHGTSPETREKASASMTEGLCTAFGIEPEIVTIYYFSTDLYSYAHAGKQGDSAKNFRIFVKVHAFPRPPEMKADAARRITEGVAQAYRAHPKDVVVYFFDTAKHDAFHAGIAAT